MCLHLLYTVTYNLTVHRAMENIRDAYSNPKENFDDAQVATRRMETDFYSSYTPDKPTYGETMATISAKHGGSLSSRCEGKKGAIVTAVPDVAAPEAAALHLKKLLDARGCSGPYEVYNVKKLGPFTNINFNGNINSMCPLCKETHTGYNFTYKVKKGFYGGWKCWKTNEWETHYVWGETEESFQ